MPYVQNKTTYVKPIFNRSEDFYKVVAEPHLQAPHIVHPNGDLYSQKEKNISFPSLKETKEKGINKFESLHSALFVKVEKMQKWKALMEVDNKQKNKKIEESDQVIESLRKVKVDLQMQNENLSLQLSKEIQQRSLILEKLHSTKGLCSALKKHFDAIQVHFDYRNSIEETFKATDSKRSKAIEDLKTQLSELGTEFAEKVSYLNKALTSEMNKSMTMKETLQQTITEAANKEESLYDILRNRENEIKKLTDENDDKRKQLQEAFHDLDELNKKVSEMEKLSEFHLQNLKETEHKLRVTENCKLGFETQYLQEQTKVKDLEEKCKELEDFGNNMKVQSENYLADLKNINLEYESSLNDWKNKLGEKIMENENLILTIKEKDEKIIKLENEVSEVHNGKLQLEIQLMDKIEEVQSKLDAALADKNETKLKVENLSEKMHIIESENEELKQFLIDEKEKHSKLQEVYEIMVLETKEKTRTEDEFTELYMKIKELENKLSVKLEELKVQEGNVSELQTLLNGKEIVLKELEIEHTELKEWIETEKKSIKICLECDSLREEVEDMNELKEQLRKKDEEILVQNAKAVETLKILSETEKYYSEDRVSKENAIQQCKELIQNLEVELKTAKSMANTVQQVTLENENLKAEIENMLKQKHSDLKSEKESADIDEEVQILHEEVRKLVPKKEKQIFLTPSMKPQDTMKQEPKVKQNRTSMISSSKPQNAMKHKPNAEENRTFLISNIQPQISSSQVKKKRSWDVDSSSGSDCYEFSFDKKSKNVTLSSKRKTVSSLKTPILKASLTKLPDSFPLNSEMNVKVMTQQQLKSKVDITLRPVTTPKRTEISLEDKALSTPKLNAEINPLRMSTPNISISRKLHFSSKEIDKTPTILQGASATSVQRKFFTTPLPNRNSGSKSLKKLWV